VEGGGSFKMVKRDKIISGQRGDENLRQLDSKGGEKKFFVGESLSQKNRLF